MTLSAREREVVYLAMRLVFGLFLFAGCGRPIRRHSPVIVHTIPRPRAPLPPKGQYAMTRPQLRFLVIRRGPVFWEIRNRDENDSKFKTTKVPARPPCERPAHCKWCTDIVGPQGELMHFAHHWDINAFCVVHTIAPPQAAHLIAFEWGKAHPDEPFTVAWILTDEEKAAGKKGVPDHLVP